MFQYAAATALAERHGTFVKIDTIWLDSDPLRSYALHNFSIEEKFVSASEREYYCPSSRLSASYLRMMIYKISGRTLYWVEPGNVYDQEFESLGSDVMINGRFQSERYFCGVKDKIRELYKIASQPDNYTLGVIDEINRIPSICLHVRRSDYVSNSRYSRILGPLPLDYYYNSLRRLLELKVEGRCFIFSDDIDWCQNILAKYIKKNRGIEPVIVDGFSSDIECFRAMCRCKHFVISNSTYAWWAAWLAEGDDKIVIAPKRWSGDGSCDSVDRIPESWVVV